MKFLIVPDSFKGTLTAREVSQAIAAGIKKWDSASEISSMPLSDGGEGFVEAFSKAWELNPIVCLTKDPLNRNVQANYIFNTENKTAIVEVAEASGITLLKEEELNPELTSTYGTGILIKEAILKGTERIILGLGGSATNDAGLGIARALGVKFLDIDHKEIESAKDLIHLKTIDDSNSLLKNKSIEFICACDIENTLTGSNGATYVFGPQKGANKDQLENLEAALLQFQNVVKKQFIIDLNTISGTGAAGGIASSLLFLANTKLVSGFDLLAEEYNLKTEIQKADLIITGEGKFDNTSLDGKLVGKVIQLAKAENKKVLVICGKSETDFSPVIELLKVDKERAFADTERLVEECVRAYFEGRA